MEKGIIISQEPEAGKSYMLSDKGINMRLTISTGVMLTEIPDYLEHDYREATSELEKLGFTVEKLYASSDTVPLDCVSDISPTPGEKLPAGATVYVTISTGPEVEMMNDKVTIRRFVPADAGEVQNLIHRGLREVNGRDYPARNRFGLYKRKF